MSVPSDTLRVTIWEDTSYFHMARIKGNNGANITQATITSIALKVFKSTDLVTATHSSAPVKTSTVFDTLQTTALDPRWTKDSTGYNFGCAVPASAFPTPGTYYVEFVFTPTSGDKIASVAEVTVKGLHSS